MNATTTEIPVIANPEGTSEIAAALVYHFAAQFGWIFIVLFFD